MSQKRIAILPGDGIGPEVIESAVRVLKTVSNDLEYAYFEVGYTRYQEKGARNIFTS